MQKVQLGGNRLGSGNKQEVTLHGYERSTHDLGKLWRSTASAGTLIPFMALLCQPGDTWDIGLNCIVKTKPLVGPMYASCKVQLDIFEAPIRLYQGQLHNNTLNIGRDMSKVKLPLMRLTATRSTDPVTGLINVKDLNNSQINPSSLLAYLGVRGVGFIRATIAATNPELPRLFNGVKLIAYWDIYKNYYANKQEEIGAVIYPNLQTPTRGTLTSIEIDGTTLPEVPASTDWIPLTNGSIITLNFTVPGGGRPEFIMFITSTGEQRLLGLYNETPIIDNVAGTVTIVYNWSKFGNINVKQWRLMTTSDMVSLPPQVRTFPLENIDIMREAIIQWPASGGALIINNVVDAGGSDEITPYGWLLDKQNGALQYLGSQSGLGLKTYQSDKFNNWLNTEWLDGSGGITEVTAVDTSGGSFTMDTFNISMKVYKMLNRIATSDGTYDSWQTTVYDVEPIIRAKTPMYHGGLIKELIFDEIVSNSESQGDGGSVPLGTLAGRGMMAQKHKGGSVTIKVNEWGYIMGIFSITPRIDYSQGNAWDNSLENMGQLHVPQLDGIGFQELIEEQMAWWTTYLNSTTLGDIVKQSAGKQVAWLDYMTNINETYGNFAIQDSEMFMTLNRRYEYEENGDFASIKDMTTYIDPQKFNYMFAETELDAQNYWVQIAVDATVRRVISAKIIPNL